MDAVAGQARDLQRQVGARDRSRLDQYFSSVRDLEHRLQESRGWADRPRPRVNVSAPTDPASPAQYMARVQVMYDLARLAFETDSTRAITLMLNSVGTPVVQIDGATITDSYHNLSHHGMAEEKLSLFRQFHEGGLGVEAAVALISGSVVALRPSEGAGLHRPPGGLKPVAGPPGAEDEFDLVAQELAGEEDETAADGKKA